jgi:hypothetical protein
MLSIENEEKAGSIKEQIPVQVRAGWPGKDEDAETGNVLLLAYVLLLPAARQGTRALR